MCPDSVIQLTCDVTNFERYDAFRWFIDTGPNSEFAHIAIDDDIVAPQRLEVLLDWLTGVEVYIVNILYNEENNSYSFQSTVSLNTSLYNGTTTRLVSCGLLTSVSNNISLHYLIVSKFTSMRGIHVFSCINLCFSLLLMAPFFINTGGIVFLSAENNNGKKEFLDDTESLSNNY